MTQEDKSLLLRDLCARLPYGVKIEGYKLPCIILDSDWLHFMYIHQEFAIRRPYLRPMSSMTKEEKVYLSQRHFYDGESAYANVYIAAEVVDWMTEHHLDFRGLIPKGLALEALEGMYNF